MNTRLYSKEMYNFGIPEGSLWEATQGNSKPGTRKLDGDHYSEVAIIGGGYTGLSTAYHLAKKYQIPVTVIEAGHIGWGASGRNGGFCSVGGVAEDTSVLIKKYGLEDVKKYFQSQIDAIELVRKIILEENIDITIQGKAEIEVARSKQDFVNLSEYAEYQRKYLGLNTSAISKEELEEKYFNSTEQYGGTALKPTFGLHPLRYINGLAIAAINCGATIYTDSEVISWIKVNNQHHLRTRSGCVKAKYVVFATNGFMPEHLLGSFKARSLPIISSIITTRPLTNEELAAQNWQTEDPVINSRKLVNYFRLLPDKRFLFGGRGSSSGNISGAEKNYNYLEKVMKRIWPNWSNVRIEHKWHGFVCFTRRLTPAIGRLNDDPSVFFGFGYHGNGVNTSTWTGFQIARWLGENKANKSHLDGLPHLVSGLSPKFPLSALRRYYLQAVINYYRLRDNVGFNWKKQA